LGLAAASALLVVVACALPWYVVAFEFEGGILGSLTLYGDHRFYVDEWEVRMTGTDVVTHDYDDENLWAKVGDVMMVESVLVLAGAVSLMFGAAAISMRKRAMATLLCGLGALMLASMTVYFFVMIPDALTASEYPSGDPIDFDSYWGSDEVMMSHWYVAFEWGPAAGWYLVALSTVLAFSAFGLVLRQEVDLPKAQ